MTFDRGRVIIVGGTGFIGSHFCDALLADERTTRLTLYDNFSSGQEWHYSDHAGDGRLQVVRADANDLRTLCGAMAGHDLVIHLASNPDIAAAMTNPAIDFHEGTLITHHVVEAMRRTGVARIAYSSGSGVYGDLGEVEATEDHGPLVPVSTYGASKLAGEALISAYAHMFEMRGCAFRNGNVVGRRQTHGVGFDFVRRLRDDPTQLTVLGNGTQSKSYILASDVVAAFLTALDAETDVPFRSFNVATGDYVTVREIVGLALEAVGLDETQTTIHYGAESRGWKGDVPVVRLNTERIRALGWVPSTDSGGALRASMQAMLDDLAVGRR
ncbi:MAG: NAD-dependent epimerase/dehydratase family protein [Solirubrobacterales bacterium]|nr:NAD-dependent epimerase/dehydratase family protein [Solirubrobacterales bacterium]